MAVDPGKRGQFIETDYAWAAGFIDGEGCLNIARSASTAPNPILNCGQIYLEPLLKLQQMFGGTIKQAKRQYKLNNAIAHYWHLNSASDIYYCLERVLPYLVCKKAEALLLMQMCKLVGKRGGKKLNPWNVKRREDIHQQMLLIRSSRKVFTNVAG